MSVRNNLQHELLKCILGNIGFAPSPYFGKAGLSHRDLISQEVVKIQYDNGVVDYPIFSGKIGFGSEILSALGVRINEPDMPEEFVVVYQINDTEINAIRANFLNYNNMLTLINIKGSWKDASMYAKLISTAGFERVASIGFDWKENAIDKKLLAALLQICDM